MINKENADEVARAKLAVKEIFQSALDLEGTLSGEHGVGITKMPISISNWEIWVWRS